MEEIIIIVLRLADNSRPFDEYLLTAVKATIVTPVEDAKLV